MHRNGGKKPVGAKTGGRGIRKRTDGSPRLIEPGGRGNPHKQHWAIAWTDRSGEKSRSRVITTGETEASGARDALTLFNAERAKPPPQTAITIRRICEAYEKGKGEEVHSPASLESALRPIKDHFGALHPSEIEPAYVRAYIALRRKAPRRRGGRHGVTETSGVVSDKTIDNELRMMRAACGWTKKHLGWKFDIPDLIMPGGGKPRTRALSRKELVLLLKGIAAPQTPPHLRVFVILAIRTGQRSGAIRALQWAHIDYDEQTIWFSRAKPDAPHNKRVRDMPMTESIAAVLQEAQANAETPFVIEYKGKPVGSLKTAWANLLKRVGIEGVRIHDLRRTAATRALNEGARLADVALYLNDSEKITARHYAHAAPALLLDVVKRIEAMGEE